MKHLSALNKYFLRYKWRLTLGIFFIIISNILAVLPAQIIRYVFDLVGENGLTYRLLDHSAEQIPYFHFLVEGIAFCGITLLFLALLRGLFMYFMRQTIIVMSRYIEYDLKNEVYTHYQQLDLNFFKMHNTGDLMSRLTEDVSRVRMYVGPALMYSVNLIVLIVMTVYTMLRVNVELTLYTLTPLPFLALTIYFVNRVIHRKSEKIQAQLSQITTVAQEAYSGIRVIKSYVQEQATAGFFESASEIYKESAVNLAKTEAVYFPSMAFVVGLSTLVTVLIGGLEAIRGNITVGSIAEFVVYVNMLTWPVSAIGWVTSMVQRASASQKRLNEFLQTSPTISDPQVTSPHLNLLGKVEMRNIQFIYPHTGIRAIKNFNLQVNPGEKVAIIGRTGSGKSTLAQLLIRMYDPQQGEVLLDGVNIRDIPLESLRRQISYVPQEVFLFSDTIANNIKFGVEGATDQEVIHAARQACVEKDILGFPQGFQTMVGERGVTLSGGQKQRISIARALIKNPNILIFDDCLSAVDAKTEKEIIGNLYHFLKDKTAIIVTHRIFSLFDFDQLIVLEDGEMIETGTHQSLMNLNGYYAELYVRQQYKESEEAIPPV
ncbi:MAG: ABC transporter ATP-binding protein [Chitinophagaceae bacterium]